MWCRTFWIIWRIQWNSDVGSANGWRSEYGNSKRIYRSSDMNKRKKCRRVIVPYKRHVYPFTILNAYTAAAIVFISVQDLNVTIRPFILGKLLLLNKISKQTLPSVLVEMCTSLNVTEHFICLENKSTCSSYPKRPVEV